MRIFRTYIKTDAIKLQKASIFFFRLAWMGGEGYQYTFGKGSGGAGTVFGPKYLPRGSFGEWQQF